MAKFNFDLFSKLNFQPFFQKWLWSKTLFILLELTDGMHEVTFLQEQTLIIYQGIYLIKSY